MEQLKKLFIKDYQNTKSPFVRVKYGIVASIFGLISNFVIFILKLVVGLLSHSVAILADSFNSFSDASSSAISLAGFKISKRPADNEHPFGYARTEFIAGLIVSFLVFVFGIILFKTAFDKIFNPESVVITYITYIVLVLSIAIKIFQVCLYSNFNKAINSTSLRANLVDSRNDTISAIVVLFSTIFIDIFKINIDGYVGLAVALFIIISSIVLLKEAVDPLLGTVIDKSLIEKIYKKFHSYDDVLGIHDLVIHNYGVTNTFAVVHVEVDSKMDNIKAFNFAEKLEKEIGESLNIHLTVQINPIDLNDSRARAIKKKVIDVIKKVNKELEINDFRISKSLVQTKVIFDLVVPFDVKISKDKVREKIEKAFDEKENLVFSIDFDRNYLGE